MSEEGPLTGRMPSDEALAGREVEEREATERAEEYDIGRADTAKRILEEPMLVEAFDLMRDTYTRLLSTCPVEDTAVFKRARYSLMILQTIEAELRHVLTTGIMQTTTRDDRREMERAIEEDRELHG